MKLKVLKKNEVSNINSFNLKLFKNELTNSYNLFLTAGEEGRNRWKYKIKFDNNIIIPYMKYLGKSTDNKYSYSCNKCNKIYNYNYRLIDDYFLCHDCIEEIANYDYELASIGKKDSIGNDLYILKKSEVSDNKLLVIWQLSPGYRGGATYNYDGNVILLGKGKEGQGEAGYMGSADVPVVVLDNKSTLTWERTGRLYGYPSEYIAIYNNNELVSMDYDTYILSISQ